MAVGKLKLELIQAAVLDYWSTNFTATANVLYPGGQLDTHDLSEWVEVSVDQVGRPREREFVEVRVSVDCWAKFGTNQARSAELADAAVAALDQARITLKDFNAGGQPTIGYLRLFGPTVEDLTSRDQERQATSAQHHQVRVRGMAQEN